jgi:hypothetical protein
MLIRTVHSSIEQSSEILTFPRIEHFSGINILGDGTFLRDTYF